MSSTLNRSLVFRAAFIVGTSLATQAFTPMALAGALKDGAYDGGGDWRSASGAAGEYTVSSAVTGDTIANVYRYGDREERWSVTLAPTANGFVDVMADGQKVGSGYCYDVQCHYTAFDGTLEETLTFYEGNLYKLGSKEVEGQRIMWQEALRLAPKAAPTVR